MRACLLALVACGGGSTTTKPVDKPAVPTTTVETFAELPTGPGNIAVTPDSRIFLSLHQFFGPEQRVVELVKGALVPLPEAAPKVDSVLGIRSDERGCVWLLDNAMRSGGKRRIVAWNTRKSRVDADIDLSDASPKDAFLNDFAIDSTHKQLYIADPAGGANAALIVVDIASGKARRVLEGHTSVIPGTEDLVIDGKPVAIKQPDGSLLHPHVGVNPIALDAKNEWLYFGPMHAGKLYRVRTADLMNATADLASKVEVYADRPITDGIAMDKAGNIYLGDLAKNGIGVIDRDRQYRQIATGPEMSWVDAFSFGPDGYVYVVANQLHRSATLNGGTDESRPPYRILRFKPAW